MWALIFHAVTLSNSLDTLADIGVDLLVYV